MPKSRDKGSPTTSMSPQEEGRTPRGKGTGATGPGTPDNSKHGPALLNGAQPGKHDCCHECDGKVSEAMRVIAGDI